MRTSALYYNQGQEKIIFFLFLVLLVWLPIPLGSNREWAWSLMEIVSSVLLLWAVLLVIGKRISLPSVVGHLKWVIFLLLFSVIFLGLQLVPLKVDILKDLSPAHIDMFSSLSFQEMAISVDNNKTIQALLKQMAYLNLFLLSIILLNSKRRMKFLLLGIAVGGVLQSILGVSQWLHLSALGFDNAVRVSGTFINKNHFAAYLNMVIASLLGLIMFEYYSGDQSRRGRALQLGLIRKVLYGFLTIVIFALVISGSRGAILAFLVSLLCLLLCVVFSPLGRKTFGVKLLLSVVLCIGITISFGYRTIGDRIVSAENDASSRMEIWDVSRKLIEEFPLFGIGAGNYSMMIPQYETHNMTVFINHAHNDYLEMLAEQGVFGFSIYLLLMFICVYNVYRIVTKTQSTEVLVSAVVGAFGVISMLAHAFLDFNFYIPSNAAYFYVFLALMLCRADTAIVSKKLAQVKSKIRFA